MKTIKLEFDTEQAVWFMYNNRACSAHIKEVRIIADEISYWFWWKNIVTNRKVFDLRDFDLSIHTSTENTFEMKKEKLFETKKELINSL